MVVSSVGRIGWPTARIVGRIEWLIRIYLIWSVIPIVSVCLDGIWDAWSILVVIISPAVAEINDDRDGYYENQAKDKYFPAVIQLLPTLCHSYLAE